MPVQTVTSTMLDVLRRVTPNIEIIDGALSDTAEVTIRCKVCDAEQKHGHFYLFSPEVVGNLITAFAEQHTHPNSTASLTPTTRVNYDDPEWLRSPYNPVYREVEARVRAILGDIHSNAISIHLSMEDVRSVAVAPNETEKELAILTVATRHMDRILGSTANRGLRELRAATESQVLRERIAARSADLERQREGARRIIPAAQQVWEGWSHRLREVEEQRAAIRRAAEPQRAVEQRQAAEQRGRCYYDRLQRSNTGDLEQTVPKKKKETKVVIAVVEEGSTRKVRI